MRRLVEVKVEERERGFRTRRPSLAAPLSFGPSFLGAEKNPPWNFSTFRVSRTKTRGRAPLNRALALVCT